MLHLVSLLPEIIVLWLCCAVWKLLKLYICVVDSWTTWVWTCVCAQWLSYVQLCDSMECILPGSSVHRIFQARTLVWVSISYSRGSSWPRDQTFISCFSCTVRQILYHCANWEAPYTWIFFSISTTEARTVESADTIMYTEWWWFSH